MPQHQRENIIHLLVCAQACSSVAGVCAWKAELGHFAVALFIKHVDFLFDLFTNSLNKLPEPSEHFLHFFALF